MSVRDLRASWQDYRIDEAVSEPQLDTFVREARGTVYPYGN